MRPSVSLRPWLLLLLMLPLAGCFDDAPESAREPPPGTAMLGCPAFETNGRGTAPGASEALAMPPVNRSMAYRVLPPTQGLPYNLTGMPAGWANASLGWIHHGPLDSVRRSQTPTAADGWVRVATTAQGPRLEGEFPAGVKGPAIAKHVAAWLVDRFDVEPDVANEVALDFVATRSLGAKSARAVETNTFKLGWAPEEISLSINGTEPVAVPEPRFRQLRIGNDTLRFALEGRSLAWVPSNRVVTFLVDTEDEAALRVEALRPPTEEELPGIFETLLSSLPADAFDVSAWKWATREILLDRSHRLCQTA